MRSNKTTNIIDDIEKVGDSLGYHCLGPLMSLVSGERMKANVLQLLINSHKCYRVGEQFEKIIKKNPIVKEPEVNNAAKIVFEKAGTRGICRFWQEHGDKGALETECLNADELLQESRKACVKAFGTQGS